MREELGVYLLEGFFIYNPTWTLLERERGREKERVRRWEIEITDTNSRDKSNRAGQRLLKGLSL